MPPRGDSFTVPELEKIPCIMHRPLYIYMSRYPRSLPISHQNALISSREIQLINGGTLAANSGVKTVRDQHRSSTVSPANPLDGYLRIAGSPGTRYAGARLRFDSLRDSRLIHECGWPPPIFCIPAEDNLRRRYDARSHDRELKFIGRAGIIIGEGSGRSPRYARWPADEYHSLRNRAIRR